MPYQDFRQFLDVLRQHGELIDIDRPVALSDVGKAMKQSYRRQGPGMVFNQNGTEFPLVAGVYSTRSKALLAFEADEKTILQKVLSGLDHPVAPNISTAAAPCHEVQIEGAAIDITRFPVPTYSPKDGGPYITPGIVVSKDPETGIPDIGHYRFLVLGRDTFSFSAQPMHRFGKNLAQVPAPGHQAQGRPGDRGRSDPGLCVPGAGHGHHQRLGGGGRSARRAGRADPGQDLRSRGAGHRRGGDRVRGRYGRDRDGGAARRVHRLLHAALAQAGGAHHRHHPPPQRHFPGPA